VLGDIPLLSDDRVLIDFRTADDGGVYRWEAGPALVQTVDFFTPIVDDPYVYGQIAAANALSDVYAMGGRPVTALAIAAFPPGEVGADIVRAIFRGGFDKLQEAGAALLGGHTVQDKEIKFGYAITGAVEPAHVWSNSGARPGDMLVLTKPLGTGVIATALKHQRAPEASASAAVRVMTALNRPAADVLRATAGAVHACTDITGFGLLGHAVEMAKASRCAFRIHPDRVPLIDGARELALANTPGGGWNNEKHFGPDVAVEGTVAPDLLRVLYDPQTSGGLLVSLDPERMDDAMRALRDAGVGAIPIGRVQRLTGAAIVLTP